MLPFMFATGIENNAPTIADGRIRRGQMEESGRSAPAHGLDAAARLRSTPAARISERHP